MQAIFNAGETARKVRWSADFQSAKISKLREPFAGMDARAPTKEQQRSCQLEAGVTNG
jgi:hypothetical protein